VLSGDSATYAEVFPDVDLVVRARSAGFQQVLVVKTPEAAANPALQEIGTAPCLVDSWVWWFRPRERPVEVSQTRLV
jgi:hypothetical protein